MSISNKEIDAAKEMQNIFYRAGYRVALEEAIKEINELPGLAGAGKTEEIALAMSKGHRTGRIFVLEHLERMLKRGPKAEEPE